MFDVMSFRFLMPVLVFLALCSGCSVSKELFEKGQKLETSGLYKESATLYHQSLQKDPTNVDASIALKRVYSKILDDNLASAADMLNKSDYEKAVYLYSESSDIVKNAKNVNVFLNIPPDSKRKFSKAKKLYTQSLYGKARKKADREAFDEAQVLLKEILKFAPANIEAKKLEAHVRQEPRYRKAVGYMESSEFRRAYAIFNAIKSYKDASDLADFCKEKASFSMVLLPIEDRSFLPEAGKTLRTHLKKGMLTDKKSFIKMVEFDPKANYKDPKYLSRLHALDIKAIFSAKLTGVDVTHPVRSEQRQGWEEYTYLGRDKKGRSVQYTGYREAYYLKNRGDIEVSFKVELNVYTTENQTPWISEVITHVERDTVAYISYSGNRSKFYVKDPSGFKMSGGGGSFTSFLTSLAKALVDPREEARAEQDKLFNARKNLKSRQELSRIALRKLSDKLVGKIISYDPKVHL